MKINSVNCAPAVNPNFKAGLKVTPAAKNAAYHFPTQSTVVSSLVFDRSMRKFSAMISGQFPFAGNVFFDTISKKTKSARPWVKSNYELRINDKSVDFDFNHHRVFDNHSNASIEEKIENESNMQAGYLYNAYLSLRSMIIGRA